MSIQVAIHQPEHMPWLGFFSKMRRCDLFVILDCVQFTKNNYQNRNRFLNRFGVTYWQTVPVKMKHHIRKEFREIGIASEVVRWQHKYLESLKINYRKSHFFPTYIELFEHIILHPWEKLMDLNMAIIACIRRIIGIDTDLILASSLNATGRKSELLVDICKKVGATSYITGMGSHRYLDHRLFKNQKIDVIMHSFSQKLALGDFPYENTSIVDILFRMGAKKIVPYVCA
ncbi:MAG: hypothetical protein C5B47_02450 [Verrucomicrobia bacterium]|nr:MAG: hypothetical protein C5B47_02450 [Verrucomicrobiota bacterium]